MCFADDHSGTVLAANVLSCGLSCNGSVRCDRIASAEKYFLFEKFSQSGLSRLGLKPLREMDLHEIWKEAEPFAVCYSDLGFLMLHLFYILILTTLLAFLRKEKTLFFVQKIGNVGLAL